ncbi:seminal metalloprotease 1 [Bactrocera dorsalis]|uniref:Metalloendopeptidase n=2 Tax=Bactrocera dorsalis TaxID=27457 RepID=A0A6I9US32_BACDO|nr:seminal metalloprotease 1 [Bactrocera dorsalis]
MKTFLNFVLLSVFSTSRSLPTNSDNNSTEQDPEENPGLFEGDIVLKLSSRNCMRNEEHHWPRGIVYFKFSEGSFEELQELFIRGAMKAIEEVSCIRFIEADDDQPYFLNITAMSRGCYSTVGFWNKVQTLNLKSYPIGKGCYRPGTIMHELLHTLGFYHMQNAYNRSKYVRVVRGNIKKGHEHNFKRYPRRMSSNFGQGYDYGSIMHYSSRAFSINGKKTIVPLQKVSKGVLGQRNGITQSDKKKLNKMYGCSKKKKKYTHE